MASIAVYTCAVGDYDWVHRPRVAPPDIDFVRFSDRRPFFGGAWTHRDLPSVPGARTSRAVARYAKVHPHLVFPGHEVAIWIDSSVEVMGDVRPLVRDFLASDADVALFPHPSGRTVGEELDFAIMAGRIPSAFQAAAERQRARYAEAGVIDQPVVESTIIFYRPARQALRDACDLWWHELTTYTERDQVSQPFAMRDDRLRIHLWNWHFDDPNPCFRRMPHRPPSILARLRTGAHFLGDSRLDYRFVRYVFRGAGLVRRAAGSLRSD